MSKCPYTWFRGLFSSSRPHVPGAPADHLHVRVLKNGSETVRVALPSQSARWLIELIPSDVLQKIRNEAIPIDKILSDLTNRTSLEPQPIFKLDEPHRVVEVWLE
jgi:hypothetical protein